MAVLMIFGTMPFQAFADTDKLSLNVTYDAKCGEPTTFTLNATGGSGNYLYYFNSISRVGEDGLSHVTDPSKTSYQEENTFQFTFCASGTYRLIFYVMDKGASPITTARQTIDIVLNDPKYPTIESIADKIAAECIQECDTEFERALWLHDWLLDNCTYDYSYIYCGAEGAFARGTGTCETYHRAYTMLLNRVGIANGRIIGNGHVWTAVKIDGEWCQIDTTWDDNGRTNHTYENYLYFGLDDTITTLVHSDHAPNSGYESNTLENNYFIKTGEIHRWSDPLTASVQQNLQAEEEAFIINVTDSMPEGYKKVIYNLVAYYLSTQRWKTETHNAKIDAGYYNGQLQITASYRPIESEGEHIWDNGTITKNATCTTDGIKTYTCLNCYETKTEVIPAEGHTIVTDKAVAPTCSTTGLTEGSHCSVCNVVTAAQETVPAIGHKAVTDVAIAATCTTAGLTVGSHCSVCNRVIVAQTKIPATGHKVVTDKAVAPTCTTTGLTEGSHCSVCNTVIIAQNTIPITEHNYDNGKITDSTCTANGVKTYTCTVCKATKTEAISTTGHKAVTDKAVAPTCSTTGLTEGSHCSICNAIIKPQNTIPTTKHSYDTGKITIASTCTANGIKTYTCTKCKATKTEVIPATSHSYDNGKITKASTCTANGTKTYTCTKCKATKAEAIPATGHSYDNGKVTNAPTTTTTGTKTYTCKNCNSTKTEIIPATGLSTPTLNGKVNANGSFTLSWNAVSEATKYGIYYKNANGQYTWVKTVTGTSWTTETAQYGRTYTYKVLAVGSTSSIVSEYSNAIDVTNKKKLQTPTLKGKVNTNGSFTLSWNKISGAVKYGIYYKNANGKYTWVTTVTGTLWTTGTAQYGRTYNYKVLAVGSTSSLTSEYSNAVNVTNNKKLQTPTLKAKVNSNGTFTLSWNKVAGATKYGVYRKNANGKYTWVKTVTGTSYKTGVAAKGKTYSYKIIAVTSKNSSASSNYSNIVSAKRK